MDVIANAVLGLQFVAAIALAYFLLKHRVHRTLPFFVTYVIYSLAATALQWACISNPHLYFNVYWLTEVGDITLAVVAACESFASTFRGLFVLLWFRWLLPALAVLVVAYAIWKAWAHPPVLNSAAVALAVGLEIGLRYFIAGLFLMYVGIRRYMKIGQSRLESNVILGFFLASAGMLLAAVFRSETGTSFKLVIEWAAPVGYSIALFVWLLSFVTPLAGEKRMVQPQIDAASAVQELTQYSSVIKKARQ